MEKRLMWGASVLAVALLIGCSHGREARAPEIKQDWLSRVPPGDMAPVEQARSQLRMMEDERNRAEAAVRDAKNQHEIAQNEFDTADNQVDTAEAAVKAARNTGDQARISRAQAALEEAEAARAAAEAKTKWTEANVEAAEKRHEFAEARVRTQEARVTQAEYEALAKNDDTRVEEYSPAQFQAAVDARERDERNLQQEIREADQKVATTRQEWNSARQRLEASRRGTPSG